MTEHWSDRLVALDACQGAVAWARTQPCYATAWAACERGDWMLWLAGTYSGPPESAGRKVLVRAACGCARLALPIWEKRHPRDGRVLACIETAERWADGTATIEDLRAARRAVVYAAYAAYADANADAAASAAANAASYVDAATYASYASSAAAYARRGVLARCANVVRAQYATPPAPRPENASA